MMNAKSRKYEKSMRGKSKRNKGNGENSWKATEVPRPTLRLPKKEKADAEREAELLERESRKNTLIIEGLPESVGESLTEMVEDLFSDMGLQAGAEICESIRRVGRKPRSSSSDGSEEDEVDVERLRPRPIEVHFTGFKWKMRFYQYVKYLRGIERWEHISFKNDLTPQQKAEERELLTIRALAKSKGHSAQVKGGGTVLVIDDQKFTYGELSKLPKGLSLEDASQVSVDDDNGIAFAGLYSALSNFSECLIVFEDRRFKSVEGAFWYTMASECDRHREANLIAMEEDPRKIRAIARTIQPIPEWYAKRESVMLEILRIKFRRNRFHQEKLLCTGDKDLYEATRDRFWGCGFILSEAQEIRKGELKGANKLGELLMVVRGELQVERG